MKLPKSGIEVSLRNSITYGQMQQINDAVLDGAEFDMDGTPRFTNLHKNARKKLILTIQFFVEKFGEKDSISESEIDSLEYEDGAALEKACNDKLDSMVKKK